MPSSSCACLPLPSPFPDHFSSLPCGPVFGVHYRGIVPILTTNAGPVSRGDSLGDGLHYFGLATHCLTGHHKDRTNMPPPPRPLGRPSFRGSPPIVGVEHGDELTSA